MHQVVFQYSPIARSRASGTQKPDPSVLRFECQSQGRSGRASQLDPVLLPPMPRAGETLALDGPKPQATPAMCSSTLFPGILEYLRYLRQLVWKHESAGLTSNGYGARPAHKRTPLHLGHVPSRHLVPQLMRFSTPTTVVKWAVGFGVARQGLPDQFSHDYSTPRQDLLGMIDIIFEGSLREALILSRITSGAPVTVQIHAKLLGSFSGQNQTGFQYTD